MRLGPTALHRAQACTSNPIKGTAIKAYLFRGLQSWVEYKRALDRSLVVLSASFLLVNLLHFIVMLLCHEVHLVRFAPIIGEYAWCSPDSRLFLDDRMLLLLHWNFTIRLRRFELVIETDMTRFL